MADGLVTFFEFKDMGFFKRNTDGEEYREDLLNRTGKFGGGFV